jgi:ribosomal peptide maturation radical SAM protein 1
MLPPRGDAAIIVPPFADIRAPALGPHLLQACARQAGFDVRVLYANLLFSARVGEAAYTSVCYAPTSALLGERIFARSAYGVPALGRSTGDAELAPEESVASLCPEFTPNELARLEREAAQWVQDFIDAVAQLDFRVIGCSTSFHQTAASVALLRGVKLARPEAVTILGGANCEGDMAHGVLSLGAGIDFVFSGECETAFPRFLEAVRTSSQPPPGVVRGESCQALDDIPLPDFSDYLEQAGWASPESKSAQRGVAWLPYESSRGCWKGERQHCTFCGMNGERIRFRAKSAARVIGDLKRLTEACSSRDVFLVDSNMPRSYVRGVAPRLADEIPGLRLCCAQKADLSLSDVVVLKKAGFAVVQPGIEALSSSLLRRMNKGVSAAQNIALLRYARAVDLALTWNLLYGFPGDQLDEYERTLELIPLLQHLHPPRRIAPLRIVRFSPYFEDPARYGIHGVRPAPSYVSVLPDGANAARIAYGFEGDYRSAALEHPDVTRLLAGEVEKWRRAWEAETPTPVLEVISLSDDQFLLLDTRSLPGTQEVQFLTRAQASLVLAGACNDGAADVLWALDRKLAVEMDKKVVPLATAEPELFQGFEAEIQESRQGQRVPGAPYL